MNYFLPLYLSEKETVDVLHQIGYVPLKNNNGYVREVVPDHSHPRYHLHLIFHSDFLVLQLHFEKFNHRDSGGESAIYDDPRLRRSLGFIVKAILKRILQHMVRDARNAGYQHYKTLNIPRIEPFKD